MDPTVNVVNVVATWYCCCCRSSTTTRWLTIIIAKFVLAKLSVVNHFDKSHLVRSDKVPSKLLWVYLLVYFSVDLDHEPNYERNKRARNNNNNKNNGVLAFLSCSLLFHYLDTFDLVLSNSFVCWQLSRDDSILYLFPALVANFHVSFGILMDQSLTVFVIIIIIIIIKLIRWMVVLLLCPSLRMIVFLLMQCARLQPILFHLYTLLLTLPYA